MKVIATKTRLSVIMSIVATILLAWISVVCIQNGDKVMFIIGIVAIAFASLTLILFIFAVIQPKNVIVYNENTTELILRGHKSMFSGKEKIININQIQKAYNITPDKDAANAMGCLFGIIGALFLFFRSDYRNTGLHITIENEDIHIKTIRNPQAVCEKINNLLLLTSCGNNINESENQACDSR